jgi:hypothetical protein
MAKLSAGALVLMASITSPCIVVITSGLQSTGKGKIDKVGFL